MNAAATNRVHSGPDATASLPACGQVSGPTSPSADDVLTQSLRGVAAAGERCGFEQARIQVVGLIADAFGETQLVGELQTLSRLLDKVRAMENTAGRA